MVRMQLFELPATITGTKSKVLYYFFKLKYIFDMGKNKTVGMVSQVLTEAGILVLLLDKYGVNFSIWELVLIFCFAVLVFTIIGQVILVWRVDKIERLVLSERDPLIADIHKEVVDKEEFK